MVVQMVRMVVENMVVCGLRMTSVGLGIKIELIIDHIPQTLFGNFFLLTC